MSSASVRLPTWAVALAATATIAFAPAALAADGKGKNGRGDGRSQSAERREGHKSDGHRSAARESGARTGDDHNPPGNNGTMKVDGLPFDDGKGNEPHVTCGFRLKFYGFDDGQTGDITIMGHSPSGSGLVSRRTDVVVSDDDAGGGNDLDALVEYTAADLDLAGLTAHPQQGYHLKATLTTDTPGGVKHKVFWFEPCVAETTPVVPLVPEVQGSVTTTPQSRATVLGVRLERVRSASAPAAAPGAEVLGVTIERAPLASTGSWAARLTALGVLLLASGSALAVLGRRRLGTA